MYEKPDTINKMDWNDLLHINIYVFLIFVLLLIPCWTFINVNFSREKKIIIKWLQILCFNSTLSQFKVYAFLPNICMTFNIKFSGTFMKRCFIRKKYDNYESMLWNDIFYSLTKVKSKCMYSFRQVQLRCLYSFRVGV